MGRAKKGLKYLLPYWHLEVLAFLASLMSTALGLSMPYMLKVFIDEVIGGGRGDLLLPVLGGFFGALCLSVGFGFLRGMTFAYIGERVGNDIRRDISSRALTLPMSFYHAERTGAVMSLYTADVPAVTGLYTSTIVNLITDLLTLPIAIGLLLYLSPVLCVIALPVLPIFGIGVAVFGPRVRRVSRAVQDKAAEISAGLQETLSGMREVKAFGQEEAEGMRFWEMFCQNLKLRMRMAYLWRAAGSGGAFLGLAATFAVLWYGGVLILEPGGALKLGALIAFVQYMRMLLGPTARLGSLWMSVQTAMAAFDRIFEFLGRPGELLERPGARVLSGVRGRLEFEGVGFRYPGSTEDALKDVSFVAEEGQIAAVVGPTGAGKTTLVDLVPRFHDPTSGRVALDGTDIRELSLGSLRAQCAVVSQDVFLFARTVRENILVGRPGASERELARVVEVAGLEGLVSRLPQGLETPVGERGAKLSGGEKQKIAIARALLRDPRVLILDEATSALDSETERDIQRALAQLLKGRTSFVIAHRLSTVQSADKLLVIDEGRLVEEGGHEELLVRGGLYARLWEIQFQPGVKGR